MNVLLGYFEYYRPNEEVASLENGKIMNQYARKIAKLNNELDQINAELEAARLKEAAKDHNRITADQISPGKEALRQW
jgi:outer membrane murein-binding lipoprotein Lpp